MRNQRRGKLWHWPQIIVVASENRRTNHADFAGFTGANLFARIVLNLHFHAGAVEAASANPCFWTVLGVVKRWAAR